MEVRKDIEGLDGQYQVSNLGNIRSIKWGGKITNIRLKKDHGGYLVFKPSIHCKRYDKKVHRVVAEAFIPKIDGKNEINHKDGNKENNRVENLEWSNRSENNKHGYDMGLKKQGYGINNPNHREIMCFTKEGEFIKRYGSIMDASRELGLKGPNIISAIKNGYNCGGYKWKYKIDD